MPLRALDPLTPKPLLSEAEYLAIKANLDAGAKSRDTANEFQRSLGEVMIVRHSTSFRNYVVASEVMLPEIYRKAS